MSIDASAPSVGFGKPPKAGQFKKGISGNPRGRPRGKKRSIPYDHLLGQMVTVRDGGGERRVTAAEAFILQLTKKGLEGCSGSARASLAAIEQARANRRDHEETGVFELVIRMFGICCVVEDLGMAKRVHAGNPDKVRLEIMPWIVQAAIDRMRPNQLTTQEQQVVLASTRSPEKVVWPAWWSVRPSE